MGQCPAMGDCSRLADRGDTSFCLFEVSLLAAVQTGCDSGSLTR